jgi:D-serine deaminase-like pyridoxal phosphate-dependent protein
MIFPELDAREVEAQHENLFATLRALEEILPYATACRDRPRPLAAARSLFDRLAEQLEVHFAAEERDEYFGRIAAADPRLARRIAELLRDHGVLRTLAAALNDAARRSDEETAWVATSRAFWQLRERLAWHEREENDLVFELHQVDLGQGG